MEGYKSFTQALDKASDTCSLWKNVDSGIEYTYPELMLVAGCIDREGTLEDPYWYVVFPDGEIAFMCVYNEEIIAMYHPLNQTGIQDAHLAGQVEDQIIDYIGIGTGQTVDLGMKLFN